MLNEPRVTPDDRSAVDHPTRAALGGAPSPPTAAQPRALNVFSSFRAGATGQRHAGGHHSGGQPAASLAHRHAGCSRSCERISIRRGNSSLKSVGGDQRPIADPANVIKGSSAGRAVSHNRRSGGQEGGQPQPPEWRSGGRSATTAGVAVRRRVRSNPCSGRRGRWRRRCRPRRWPW